MVKLPPPTSKKLAAKLAANAAERMKGASDEKYGAILKQTSGDKTEEPKRKIG